MKELDIPQFQNYEEEAKFWDKLDTADFMPDDNEWVHFDTDSQRALRIAILPTIAQKLMQRANAQGVSIETLVNVLLAESIHEPVLSNHVH